MVYLTKDCEMTIIMVNAIKRNRVVDALLFRLVNIILIINKLIYVELRYEYFYL